MTITNKNYKRSQKGRSMVEMLGVLAIVGTLSVGGVYGYGVAMKKHKANELLHRASMLASTVSAQIMSGKDPTALDTFADSNLGKFALDYDPTKTTFDLKISELDGSVCSQLKEGGMAQKVQCNETAKTATITYYKNLATDPAEGEKSPTGSNSTSSFNPSGATKDDDGAVCSGDRPGECSVCLSTGESTAHWYDSDALCTTAGQTCVDGACVDSAADEPDLGSNCKCLEAWGDHYCGGENGNLEYCSSDADCVQYGTWDSAQEKCVANFCTNNSDCTSDEYCHYSSFNYDTCKPDKKGKCMAKADAKRSFQSGATAEEDGFVRSVGYMDWFSAQNFCRSYGKNLVTLSQMGLGSAVPSGKFYCNGYSGNHGCQITADEWSAIQGKFGDDFCPWTANLDPNHSCRAFFVNLDGDVDVGGDSQYNNHFYGDFTGSALCK